MKIDVFFIFASIILILSFFSILFWCAFILGWSCVSCKNGENVDFEVQVLFVDKPSNEYSFGIATVVRDIPYSFFDTHEKYVMTSLIGSAEYSCTGSCFCENRRGIAGSLLSNGVFFLVSAISSAMAFEKATEYFDEKCVDLFSQKCDQVSLRSEVDECSYVTRESSEDGSSVIVDDEMRMRDIRKYICKGNCIKQHFKRVETDEAVKEIECSKMKMSCEVEIDVTEMKLKDKNSYAVKKFMKDRLSPYCKTNSKIKIWYDRPDGSGTGEYRKVTVCVARSKGINSSLHCRQVFPTYQSDFAKKQLTYW